MRHAILSFHKKHAHQNLILWRCVICGRIFWLINAFQNFKCIKFSTIMILKYSSVISIFDILSKLKHAQLMLCLYKTYICAHSVGIHFEHKRFYANIWYCQIYRITGSIRNRIMLSPGTLGVNTHTRYEIVFCFMPLHVTWYVQITVEVNGSQQRITVTLSLGVALLSQCNHKQG